MKIPKSFLGYKRENGRVGTRNHVVILPVDDISNACAEAVANNIKGTFAIPHAYGRLQFGADLELFFDTMIGTGKNPNVAACVVIEKITPNQDCNCWIMENDSSVKIQSKNEIPLGHKIAMIDFNEGDTIIKYGHDIGKVVKSIKKGEHVHVHNVKTKKW